MVKTRRKAVFTPTIFPTVDSDPELYSETEPFFIQKLRIEFRTTAGPNEFRVKNLQLALCVDKMPV